MKFLWAAVVQNGSFYVNMKSLDEGSKSWHDLRLHHCCQYCDCDIQWTARIWASVSLQKTSSDGGQNSQHSYHRISLTSRQGHSHEKLLGKGQHSLSLGDDSHAHPVWSWSLVTSPIMVSITSCVAPSALVSACIMPSHTSHEGKSHGLRSASARTDGGHWAMCPPQGRTENWLSRCVTLSCLQQPQLAAQAAHCSGRSVMAGLRPPAHHGLGSLSRVYIRDWPGGIKTAIKEELILSMNNGMLRSVSKMSYDQ